MFQTIFTRFPAFLSMKTNKFSFSQKLCFQNLIVFKCFKTIFPFSSRFQYENENFFVFKKIPFSKSNRFQMYQNDFSVFQPFYEIPKGLEKQFCSRFKIQKAYQNAQPKIKTPMKTIVFKNAALHQSWGFKTTRSDHSVCTLCMYTLYVHSVCTLCMYTLYVLYSLDVLYSLYVLYSLQPKLLKIDFKPCNLNLFKQSHPNPFSEIMSYKYN